ncbi:MAG: hypothetical protein AAFV01_05095, partial [Bacteroidota bacterium]
WPNLTAIWGGNRERTRFPGERGNCRGDNSQEGTWASVTKTNASGAEVQDEVADVDGEEAKDEDEKERRRQQDKLQKRLRTRGRRQDTAVDKNVNGDAMIMKPRQKGAKEGDGEVVAKDRQTNTETRASTISKQSGHEGRGRRSTSKNGRIPPRRSASVHSDEAPKMQPKPPRLS